MKHRQFLMISNLTKVRNALEILKDITPAENGVIPLAEITHVKNKLARWSIEIYSEVDSYFRPECDD